MYLLLTDLLTCPRCGPAFGLILLAREMADRRVREGLLGCANCREQYPIEGGVGDFAGPAAGSAAASSAGRDGAPPSPSAPTAGEEDALRVAALLGVTEGPGYILLLGPATAHADMLAGMIPDIEVLAAFAGGAPPSSAAPAGKGRTAVSQIRLGTGGIPLSSGRLAGVAVTGDAVTAWLGEAMRVLKPLGRLVVEPATGETAEAVRQAGLQVLLQQDGTLVAARTGPVGPFPLH
jgi:uncharacterized protein YbaR (Trm112 family)